MTLIENRRAWEIVGVLLGLTLSALGTCPYNGGQNILNPHVTPRSLAKVTDGTGGGREPEGGFQAVLDDLKVLMTDSKDFWPGDFAGTADGPHYGGLFIRLAWHCSGSYREHDGRGGCDGGRIRFDPELNWPDNANLDKALQLLKPIKEEYGDDLSWGDLIILSGNAAIESMGGKTLGFCGGRIDDSDGSDSLKLGPSPEQESIGPCLSLDKQGLCLDVEGTALGPTTMGLIYVNPAGPVGNQGDPVVAGSDIRMAFSRMGFDDRESVALIGGGHAFGKMHAACRATERPCGGDALNENGPNTFTSGFEGQWTTRPTTWSNDYFTSLFDETWTLGNGTGGELQFFPENEALSGLGVAMLVTDVALVTDDSYRPISQEYADDITKLETDFATAWYRLTAADMGPSSRCVGGLVADPQPWQASLPVPSGSMPDYVAMRAKIQSLLDNGSDAKAMINLAYRCAATFRATDYRGGCNGARIRFSPEKDWPANAGTAETLTVLEEVKAEYPDAPYSDIIVLAGQTAIENNADISMPFCGGKRVDADDAAYSASLAPRIYATANVTVYDDMQVKGLTPEEYVALAARTNLGTSWFAALLEGGDEFSDLELGLLEVPEFQPIVAKFSTNEVELFESFKSGWTKLMTADLFKNNYENLCTNVNTQTLRAENSGKDSIFSVRLGALIAAAAGIALM